MRLHQNAIMKSLELLFLVSTRLSFFIKLVLSTWLQAKPDANYPGKKRKDISSPVDGPSEVTKKLTKEWTCALCRISATSELGLEDHLKGKKHKSKQAGQKTGMIGLCSKKFNDTPNSSQVVESVELEKSQQITNKHETGVENNKAIVMEKGCGGPDQKMPKKKRMNFKYYCKICEVGAFCEEVMANHKKGKKHLIRLHQLGAKRWSYSWTFNG